MIRTNANSAGTGVLLQAVMGGAATTTNPSATVSYIDLPPQTTAATDVQRGATYSISLNGASDVTIGGPPGTSPSATTGGQAGWVRMYDYIGIVNRDTVAQTITVKTDDGGTEAILYKVTLQTLEALYYEDGEGWYAEDANGNRKVATTSVNSSAILGTTTNDNAAAGRIGEYVESVVSATSFPTSGQFGDLTSISLTAGDWDVSSVFYALQNGSTITRILEGISSTSGNSSAGMVLGSSELDVAIPTAGVPTGASIPCVRFSLSGTTTIYLKYFSSYSVATPTAQGRLSARRAR